MVLVYNTMPQQLLYLCQPKFGLPAALVSVFLAVWWLQWRNAETKSQNKDSKVLNKQSRTNSLASDQYTQQPENTVVEIRDLFLVFMSPRELAGRVAVFVSAMLQAVNFVHFQR